MSNPDQAEIDRLADYMSAVAELTKQHALTPVQAIQSFGSLTRWLAEHELNNSDKSRTQVMTEAIGFFSSGFGVKMVSPDELQGMLGRDHGAPLQ